ncbi:flavin reductase [Bradyrhizobium canariense]|uniref:flavin reductase family protein n=1 Tax=Bradyrhizobium canariense TaxID=255045 RepID=UPI001C683412|nr:flavin reductase family protein [Bradyrhizobium canariense]MBW5435721.1 flavin reductase [Bradyrhizobium canariense]
MNGSTAEDFRRLFRRLTTGVTLIAVAGENAPAGMTVNSLTPVSLDPPLLLFCASLTSATAKRIASVGAFSVNILAGHQQDVSMHHAGRPLANPTWCWRQSSGVPWVDGANAIFRCHLVEDYPGGDHRILIGQIDEMFGPDTVATPLLYHGGRYARLPYEDGDVSNMARTEDLWWTG